MTTQEKLFMNTYEDSLKYYCHVKNSLYSVKKKALQHNKLSLKDKIAEDFEISVAFVQKI